VLDVVTDPYEQQQCVVFQVEGQTQHLMMRQVEFEFLFSPVKLIDVPIETKMAMFKHLFIARSDVYAQRWFNKSTKKWVYSPARDYQTRALMPISDGVIKQHLLGKRFIGLYPLTQRDQTSFLVLDFDKGNWREMMPTIRAVGADVGLMFYVEVSQSGNGGHCWLFFVNPVSAMQARQLGNLILQRAMQLNPRLDFEAFDRLLPNQDRLPIKGFGNLIAAPLQGERLSIGRSVFVDEHLVPYQNQWDYLATVQKADELQVSAAIQQLTTQLDSVQQHVQLEQATLNIELGAQVAVDLTTVSDSVIQHLRQLGTFKNPKYFTLLKQRRSVFTTPRYLNFTEISGERLMLPRGLMDHLTTTFKVTQIVDQRVKGQKLEAVFQGQLYPEQTVALNSALEVDNGLMVARTGFGKTVVAAALIAKRHTAALIVVPSADLARQWQQALVQFLDIKGEPHASYTAKGHLRKVTSKIGLWAGAKKQPTQLVDVVTIQALVKMRERACFLAPYGLVIFDEVHHTAAVSYDEVVRSIRAKYLYGLTATLERSDGLTPLIRLRFGEVLFESPKVAQQTLLSIRRRAEIVHTSFGLGHPESEAASFVQLNEELIYQRERNQLIVAHCLKYRDEKQLVLVNRVKHVEILTNLLQDQPIVVYQLTGSMANKEREKVRQQIRKAKYPYILVATGSVAGEGVDFPDLTVLHLVSPRAFSGTIAQYLGRLERHLTAKKQLTVVDYVDVNVSMLAKMYLKRLRTYRSLAYEVIDHEDGQRLHNLEMKPS
jgi:superfamily II DNA or RNA helicase